MTLAARLDGFETTLEHLFMDVFLPISLMENKVFQVPGTQMPSRSSSLSQEHLHALFLLKQVFYCSGQGKMNDLPLLSLSLFSLFIIYQFTVFAMAILSEHSGKVSGDCVTHSMKSDIHDAGGHRILGVLFVLLTKEDKEHKHPRRDFKGSALHSTWSSYLTPGNATDQGLIRFRIPQVECEKSKMGLLLFWTHIMYAVKGKYFQANKWTRCRNRILTQAHAFLRIQRK
ncbi:hypothetical protein ACRRTK_018013 [Alexandromys fortis]